MFHRRLTDSQHAGKKPFDCRSKLSELLQRSTKGARSFHLFTTNLRLSHTCCPPAVHTSTRALGRSDKRCPHPFVTGGKPARERGRSRTGACRYATLMHSGRLLMAVTMSVCVLCALFWACQSRATSARRRTGSRPSWGLRCGHDLAGSISRFARWTLAQWASMNWTLSSLPHAVPACVAEGARCGTMHLPGEVLPSELGPPEFGRGRLPGHGGKQKQPKWWVGPRHPAPDRWVFPASGRRSPKSG